MTCHAWVPFVLYSRQCTIFKGYRQLVINNILQHAYVYNVMHAVTCDDPPTRSLQDRVMIVDKESDIPIMEGQFIAYTCPSGFILTGPSASECMRNREWEPDPGEVDCIGNHL